MKTIKPFILQTVVIVFLFPAMLLLVSQLTLTGTGLTEAEFFSQTETYTILVGRGGELTPMDLESYVVGVVLAEMPADFEPEALKAQAAVARTFAWKASLTGGKHGNHSVCTVSSCCQGYLSPEDYLRYYGTTADVEKVKNAVEATAGIVITYENELIEATYFSSAGGFTEDAVAVWGNFYPYLVSVESPEAQSLGEKDAAFSRAYLENTLHTRLEGNPGQWFHHWQHTPSGGVAQVGVGNRVFSGTELRKLLNLRSTVFSVTVKHDVVFFHTRGQGHRVGMSQYGAEAMAAEGNSWEEILRYYYTGVDLISIDEILSGWNRIDNCHSDQNTIETEASI